MNRNRSHSASPRELPRALFGALLLAALGQVLLARQDQAWTAWAGTVFFLASGLLLAGTLSREPKASPFSARLEGSLFFLILLVALFFRLYRLDQFPPGLFNDVAKQGYGALRILHEGWNPFQESGQFLGGSLCSYFYWLALWFHFAGPSDFQLRLASAVLSLMALPPFYLASRRLAGPRAALLALFFLSVMRWNVTYARSGHPAVEVAFYLFGALAAWLALAETGSRWALGALFLFLAGGCYAYESFLAFLPALALYGLYEARYGRTGLGGKALELACGSALFLAATFPICRFHLARGSFGASFDRLSALPAMKAGGLGYLAGHLAQMLLMFNRRGDNWFVHNIPDHRMLDDATGTLLVLAVVYGLAHWRERRYFYGLTGLGCLLLPNFLSTYPIHASRAIGAAGFAAFLAACVLDDIRRTLAARGPWAPALLAGTLVFCAAQNYSDYFGEQAHLLEPWRGHGWEATRVGEKIQALGDKDDYVLAPSFYGHYALLFLDYPQRSFMRELELPKELALPAHSPGRGVLFALPEGQTGVLQLLRDLYPGGVPGTTTDPGGRPLVHFYEVPAENIPAGTAAAGKYLGGDGGLAGSYFASAAMEGKPTLVRRDPLLNFIFRNDFALRRFPPLSVEWKGFLRTPIPGTYRFLLLTTDQARLVLDGKPLCPGGNQDSAGVPLSRGAHALEVSFQKTGGTEAALSLLWMKPGDIRYEVVPATVLRQRR